LEPFIAAQWMVQGVFKPEIPALSHLMLLVGTRFRLGEAPAGGGG
jgi:hypothetical protein